jgi:hypothetical protein
MRIMVVLLSVALVELPVHCVGAQAKRTKAPNADEPPGYRDAINRALEEVELQNFEEAREQFVRAHALWPSARTLRGLGVTSFELRRYVEAVEFLQQALDSSVKVLEGNVRRETEGTLARARSYVGSIAFELEPRDAKVVLDGLRTIDVSAGPALVQVGDHLIEVSAVGYLSSRVEVRTRGEHTETVTIRLNRAEQPSVPMIASAPVPSEPVRAERRPLYKQWWLWTLVGLVVAGGVTGAMLVLSKDKSTEYVARPSENTPEAVSLRPLRRF